MTITRHDQSAILSQAVEHGDTSLLEALRGHVIAKGCLVGTYERV